LIVFFVILFFAHYILNTSFQVFVDQMKQHLQQLRMNSPLHANINTVLPGVNHRLDEIITQVSKFGNGIEGMKDDMVNKMSYLLNNVIKENRSDLARHYATLALSLSGISTSITSKCGNRTILTDELTLDGTEAIANGIDSLELAGNRSNNANTNTNELTNADVFNDNDDYTLYKLCTMRNPIISILNMYQEYNGLGDYAGDPIPGGKKKLDERFGTKWYKHFDEKDKTHYNRCRRIVRKIDQLANSYEDFDRAVEQIETLFNNNRKSLYGMDRLMATI
jgi:Transcriptional activator of glycolytic enzymes